MLYGAARLTADIDVTVGLGDRPARDLVAALRKAGFELRVRDLDDFVARTRVLPFWHARTGIPVDVVLGGPGLEERFIRRRRRRAVEGVPVFVASAEDVVVMKVLAGRAKDDDDVAAILAARRSLDIASIRRMLRELERALDQSDLRPRFDALIAQSNRRSPRPR